MGFDTSYHAVDLELHRARIIPYILGRGSIDDLVERAVRIGRLRFRANAWGLACSSVARERGKAGAKLAGFDAQLHVWGRPFFVAGEGPAVSRTIDRYLAARDEVEVDAIAREQVAAIDPALQGGLKPNTDGQPGDAASIRWKVDLLRDCVAAMRQGGGPVRSPGGDELDAREILQRELPLRTLELAANFRPGWMDRGVWPTRLLAEAQIATDLFTPPRPLVEPVAAEVPGVSWFLESGIVENDMVGGFVAADRVGALRSILREQRGKIVEAAAAGDDDAPRTLPVSLQKLDEALADAELRKMPFCEATEVYSGFSGIMN